MRRIVLVQHCQSEHHVNDMSGGWTDTPLTELGQEQAVKTGSKLKNLVGDNQFRIISSDLLRARGTAEIIANILDSEVEINSGLREINTGIAAGKTKVWAKENRNPEVIGKLDLDYLEFENGETRREFFYRISKCISLIVNQYQEDLIIVTHGGTIGFLTAWWLKFDAEMLEKAYFQASVGSISILYSNRYNQNTLNVFNDRSHLE